MTGLELAQNFYQSCRPLLIKSIPDIMKQACAGLVGEGSECFGCDDKISQDHDFGAAFCFWLPENTLKDNFCRIEDAFNLLPKQFEGFPSYLLTNQGRRGPLAIENFYNFFIDLNHPPTTWQEWLKIPEFQLAAATNGKVFEDNLGLFTQWRQALLAYYPRDIWLKKLATKAMLTAQAGQYNFPRAIKRNNYITAMLAKARFAENALGLVYLLNRRYMPFYKWAPKLAKNLPLFGNLIADILTTLTQQNQATENISMSLDAIEHFCASIAAHLQKIGLINAPDPWLWAHGPTILKHVENREITKLNLLQETF